MAFLQITAEDRQTVPAEGQQAVGCSWGDVWAGTPVLLTKSVAVLLLPSPYPIESDGVQHLLLIHPRAELQRCW